MHGLIYKMLYIFILTVNFSVVLYNITSTKLSNRSIGTFTLINYFISYVLYMCGFDNILRIFIVFSLSIYIYIEYRRVYYSMIITTLTVIIYALSDLIIGSIEIILLNVNRTQIVNSSRLYFTTMILILINSFIISKFIKRFTVKYGDLNLYFNKYIKYMLLLISYLIVVVLFIFMFLKLYDNHPEIGNEIFLLYSFFVVYSFLMIIILLITSHKNIKRELEKEHKDKEDAQLKEYTTQLEVLTYDLRKFRHDYLNILKTLEGYIELGDIDKLKDYYNDIVHESEEILNKENKNFMLLQYIKIDALKSLIASKITNAQSLGIKIRIEISEDIDEISIKLIDICRIIGIFLDNAIEAAMGSEEKAIEFAIIKNEGKVIFIIINSCTKDTPPIYKLYEKNFSTKGSHRGIGLKIVRELISEKYSINAILNTKIFDSKFMQEFIINNSNEKIKL